MVPTTLIQVNSGGLWMGSVKVNMMATNGPSPGINAVMSTGANPSADPVTGLAGNFQQAMEAADIGLWHWDLTTDVVSLSPTAGTLFGCAHIQSPDYTVFIDLIDQDDRAMVEKTLRDSIATGGHFDFDFRARTTGRWLRARGQAFGAKPTHTGTPHAGSGVAAAAGILLDASRRASTDQLNSRLAALVLSSDDAIVGETLDGTVTDWNRGAEAVFGYTAAEMIGRPLATLLPPNRPNETLVMLDRLKRGERIEHYETQRRRKDGTVIDVSADHLAAV